jgi:hypothetical protein
MEKVTYYLKLPGLCFVYAATDVLLLCEHMTRRVVFRPPNVSCRVYSPIHEWNLVSLAR